MNDTSPTLLARLDLTDAPVGMVFHRAYSDTSVEDRYFAGWRLPLLAPPYWKRTAHLRIEEEAGRKVLHHDWNDQCMIAGDTDWQDYTVTADVRLISDHQAATDEHPHDTIAKAGLIARYQTNRHYYYLAIQSDHRVVLYRRHHEHFDVLAEAPLPHDRRAYVCLSLQLAGDRITGRANDVTIEARDAHYANGPAGWRTLCKARFADLHIKASEEELTSQARRREKRLARDAAFQSRFPRESLAARHPAPDQPFELQRICRVGERGSWGRLLSNSRSIFSPRFSATYATKEPEAVAVADMHGRILWRKDLPLRFLTPHDFNGDGRDEIAALLEDRLVILSSADGSILRETPLPLSCPFQGERGKPIDPDLNPIHPADLRGADLRRDLIFSDERDSHAGRTLWAYDHNLKPLWTARVGHPRTSHHFALADVDGDGRDEILAGFHCFRADGSLWWNCKDAELNDDDHIDEVQFGLYGPSGEPRACGTNGDDGFHLLDGATGEIIARHQLGHVQGVSVGNYLPDRPGMDYLVGCRWGSFGLLSVVDALGRVVTTFEPDHISQGGPPCRWTGDGRDLIFLSTSREAFGLWDGEGRRAVDLQCREMTDHPARYGVSAVKGSGQIIDLDRDGRDEIVFTQRGELFVYKASH